MDNLKIAREVFESEAQAIIDLNENLNENFDKAIKLILSVSGRCIISGIGKSGHIGQKISSTLASTGTPSFFIHPSEALHGDLGMITQNDVLIAISNSGESEEILKIIPSIKNRKIPIIALSGNANSTLAKNSDVFLNISVKKEACPLQLAPMSSTTVTLVFGDAIAAALMKNRDFKPNDFAIFHPGGSLGKRLLTKVKDAMTKEIPALAPEAKFGEIIDVITKGKLGLCVVLEGEKIVGIITDGDLRRVLNSNNEKCFNFLAKDFMNKNPRIINADEMAVKAKDLMIKNKIKELIVSENDRAIGIIQLYSIGGI